MNNRNHYVYRIDCPYTEKFYIGVRTCDCDIEKDEYMGSMRTWEPQNPNTLKKKILKTFGSREGANKYERELIKKHFSDPLNENHMIPNDLKRKNRFDDAVNLWMGSTLKADAQRLAQKRDRSLSSLIRRLLRREVKNDE